LDDLIQSMNYIDAGLELDQDHGNSLEANFTRNATLINSLLYLATISLWFTLLLKGTFSLVFFLVFWIVNPNKRIGIGSKSTSASDYV
jgi:hypothetical protein